MITLEDAIERGRGVERPFCCHVHGDTVPSASVNVEKGLWFCYACGASGAVGGKVTPSIKSIISLMSGESRPRVYPESWLDIFDAWEPSPYWARRYGIAVAAQNRCGTHIGGNPTYPLRSPSGEVWGVIQRTGLPDRKYLYPAGAPVSTTFHAIGSGTDVIVLVEGAADAMALDQSGLPDGWGVRGCFGAGLHAPQVEILKRLGPRTIISAFDADEAGERASRLAQGQCSGIAPVITHTWSAKDPGELGVQERMSELVDTFHASAKKITHE